MIDRGVRLAIESDWPISHVANDIGLPAGTLLKKVRQREADQGLRPAMPTSEELEQIRELKREVAELRRANKILKAASVLFAIEPDTDRTS